MELEKVGKILGSKPPAMEEEEEGGNRGGGKRLQTEGIPINKKHLLKLLEECQRTLELLRTTTTTRTDDNEEEEKDEDLLSQCVDSETSQLCDLLKSTVESPNFVEKLGSVHAAVQQSITEEGSSWDMINDNDFWEGGKIDGDFESDVEGYVVVRQEDIMEGIACFLTTYLLSIQHNRELSPDQLQEALSKTFSVKKKKGKLQKAWDGSKVIYNLASWGATAVGIYQNPAFFKASSMAFWSSCRILSKLF